MQTRSLRTLTRIAQLGSFAAAAEQLNMTLSAVSSQMKALEAELDAPLFDRRHRPPQLTPLGRAVCEQAQQVLDKEASLVALCQTDGALTGRFRVGFVATASVRLLPDFLVAAQRHAPAARFDIETAMSDALETRVQAGQLDAAVVTASSKPPTGLSYHLLRSEQMRVAAPAQGPQTLEALFHSLPFLHFLPNSGIGKVIARFAEPYRVPGGRVIYLDSVEAILECVNRGIGFTVLPEPDILRAQHSGVSVRDLPGQGLFRDLVLATATALPANQADQLQSLLRAP